jgi:hypothetical protein
MEENTMTFFIKHTVFEKVEKYKKLLSPLIKGKTDDQIRFMLLHCKGKRNGRKRKLTKDEMILYDFLLKNNLSANIMYEKFVCLNYPENIKKLLREKKIGVERARKMYVEQKSMKNTKAGQEIMKEIMEALKTLQWPGIDNITKQA